MSKIKTLIERMDKLFKTKDNSKFDEFCDILEKSLNDFEKKLSNSKTGTGCVCLNKMFLGLDLSLEKKNEDFSEYFKEKIEKENFSKKIEANLMSIEEKMRKSRQRIYDNKDLSKKFKTIADIMINNMSKIEKISNSEFHSIFIIIIVILEYEKLIKIN